MDLCITRRAVHRADSVPPDTSVHFVLWRPEYTRKHNHAVFAKAVFYAADTLSEYAARLVWILRVLKLGRALVKYENGQSKLGGASRRQLCDGRSRGSEGVMKRVFDITVALFATVAALPVLVLLALAVKVTSSPGPTLYRGLRAGLGGRPFRILKFRTMVQNADQLGGPSTSGDDPRLTRIGRVMRRFKLDELPQLLNVLAGDMSFVGPRPEVLSEVEEYTEEQRQILQIRPGITDWASIWNSNEESVLAGAADPHEAYKRLIQPTKLRLQLAYCHERTFLVDVEILLGTLLKLFRPTWVPGRLKQYGQPMPPSATHHVRPT